ncbi:MarR family winged helix-turn-helix transcriptional regulator [Kitasatospora sp. HPMI-4]|uniref:MarR family winged helix-turn-helix transcriptional regulator n=1 Tax=Kitasatospora sp. HPMI-4 TaxID=3448443 RepID=UPI003F1DA4AD
MDRRKTAEPAPPADAVDAITAQWAGVRPDLETTAMAAFGRISRISRAMSDRMEAAYAPFGIGLGEFDVVATLRRSGAPYTLSPRELSSTLMLTSGGMTGRLDKLERAGLITRSPDPNDRRALRVTLTETGIGLVDQAVAAGLAVQQEALGSLSPTQAAALNDLLRHLMTTAGP